LIFILFIFQFFYLKTIFNIDIYKGDMSVKLKNENTNIKKSQTLDNKHKEIVRKFQTNKDNIDAINQEIDLLNEKIIVMDKTRDKFTLEELKIRAKLLNDRDNLELSKKNINDCYDELDYYDKTGDLIIQYYELRNDNNQESKNIMKYLGKQNIVKTQDEDNREKIFEKYWKRIEGVRIVSDDGSNRIKYCIECNIEKVLDYSVSAYICPCCGDSEEIILDEDRQIKDYSPYRRINHFREWLNQFQAKQSPEIPEEVYVNIIDELNKNRITDYSELNKKKMKLILKKLNYNSYYEHAYYIINKLSNLPPPKITRDMEKIFIKMFIKIEAPWEIYKQPGRKNFISYSYVLYKFCELLELDHLLDCFTLHKDHKILLENDEIWKKICKHLNWQFICSGK
jgi:predicted RNA-binding Zn-ribbon protein involved in translation (DUF1610 family)